MKALLAQLKEEKSWWMLNFYFSDQILLLLKDSDSVRCLNQ